MPPNNPDEPVLGDPLFPGSSQDGLTPPQARRPLAAQPKKTESRSRTQRQGAITQAIVTPGVRLALSVLAVFIGTVALGQAGAEPNPAAPTDSSLAPNDTAGVPTAKKIVLVSDPANTAIVREIAGDLLTVDSIIPPGANGHTYEPVPGDAIKAATADLYIENGMELNTAVTKFVRANYRQGTKEVNLSEVIPPAEVISTDSAEDIAAHGHSHAFNAHFWTDPIYAIAYAKRIAQSLEQLDPDNAATYQARATAFIERLTVMDTRFKEAIASIPEQNRKLIVYHDSWSYFGRRYGIPVIGAIQPVSFSEPSANEIRRMIDQIRGQKVPAFFGSEVFPSEVLDAVAAETGAKYYSDLSDEELPGEPGTPQHSYEGMMIENVRLITSALGGDVSILANLVPGAAQ
ncbi:unannotated protein [freshwater metagenome]|uniref:Unannotated protein n=1 Tax=freshwater metagenome TaxID=449393 RepID=A0A6J6DFY0_9ZZZZ|nr:zinc ABC transporter substrate-binding protein [Actinomycetota bacterium]